MILVIDNYDSFSYNLVQVLGEIIAEKTSEFVLEQEMCVKRNDEITVEEIMEMNPTHIILSPGPGKPKDAGICEQIVSELKTTGRILGVCLGHQAICETFGATITYAKQLMHGKQSEVAIKTTSPLFVSLPPKITVARYHSLVADEKTIPEELEVIAQDKEGTIMAVEHRHYEIYGVQFHPESVLTPYGKDILANFLYGKKNPE